MNNFRNLNKEPDCLIAARSHSIAEENETFPMAGSRHRAMEHPYTASTLERVLSRDPRFEGIGEKRAAALREMFGASLHQVLSSVSMGQEGHNSRAILYEVLPEKIADTLLAVYPEMIAEMDLAQWLDEIGVDAKIAANIVKAWGAAGASSIRANPFLLVGWIGWKQVVRIARAMGLTVGDRRWQVGAVEAVLYQGLDEKHTIVRGQKLRNEINRLFQGKGAPLEAAQAALDDAGAAVWGNGLQPVGAALMEAYCADRIKEIAGQSAQTDLIASQIQPHQIDEFLASFDETSQWSLTDRQRKAIGMALTNRLSLLAGYAGAGKTTVLRTIADLAETYGRELHLMALSGRAAKRISEATGRSTSTIAKFLMSFSDDFIELGPESFVIIDEASMVDLPTFYRVLRRLGQGNLLLVGDPAQLPPIGFGLVFHTLIESSMVPRTFLDRVLRQTDSSGIPIVAKAIRTGRTPELKSFDGRAPGVSFVPCEIGDAIQCIMNVGKEITSQRGETQIISPIKAGDAGIEAINHAFSNWRGNSRDSFPGRLDIKVGDPVIWTKNDYDRNLQNGSMGRYLRRLPDGKALVDLDGQELELTQYDAEYIELAYAISVHKAQGSQWDRVIIPVFQSRILDRSLIYTAITRAVEQIVLIGDLDSIEAGLQRAESEMRQTTLSERLIALSQSNIMRKN